MSELASSPEYLRFRSCISQKRICVDSDGEEMWTLYDAGPKEVKCPLVFFPPVSGQADIYFKQLLALANVGYRVISVQYPVYWNIVEFSNGFRRLIDHLHLDKVHIFGASLGGYLAQKFAEHTRSSQRVHSLILCNTFVDTAAFHHTTSASTFWMTPAIILKKFVMGGLDKKTEDAPINDTINFMAESLEGLSQQELASRLTFNCSNDYVQPQRLRDISVMLIDVNDGSALSLAVTEEMYKCYPDARRAHLKSGGNFPFLSRAEEVNVFIQVHLSQFIGTKHSALAETGELFRLYQSAEESASGSKVPA